MQDGFLWMAMYFFDWCLGSCTRYVFCSSSICWWKMVIVVIVCVCVSFEAAECVNSFERRACLGRCAWYMFFVHGHLVNERCDVHACLAGVSTARGVLELVVFREMLTNLSKTWYEKHCIWLCINLQDLLLVQVLFWGACLESCR